MVPIRALRPLRRAAAITTLVAAAAASFFVAPARAHTDHGKPMYGGVVAEAGAFQGELVAGPKGTTLYITDHGTPVPTAGATAKLVVLSGAQKSERELVPAGDNRFSVSGGEPLAKGSKAVATVKLKDGRSGALRFDVR
jgi:hypothetical protein